MTDFEPKALMRRFSERLAEQAESSGSNSVICAIVVDNVKSLKQKEIEDAKARLWWEPWKATTEDQNQLIHKKQAIKLSEAWALFRHKIPEKERLSMGDGAPTFEDVIQVVSSIQQRWERERNSGKRGIICHYFRRCCLSIKSHETMLKILPEGNEYCSLFTGVLKSVVYATANHERISLGLARSIAEIGDLVAECQEVRDFYDTEKMQESLMLLYAEIFGFLRGVLVWYLDKVRKRLVKSFNEDLYEEFQDQLEGIRHKAKAFNHGLKLGQAGEIRTVRLMLQSLQPQVALLTKRLNDRELLESNKEQVIRQEDLAKRIDILMLEQATRFVDQVKEALPPSSLLQPTGGAYRGKEVQTIPAGENQIATLKSIISDTEAPQTYTLELILECSASLEDYFDRSKVRVPYDVANVWVPNEACASLQRWALANASALLAIVKPESMHTLEASPTQRLAASIVDFVEDSKLPVISYFCDLNRRESLPLGVSAQAKGTATLVYALLRQTLELLPQEITTSSDLSPEEFENLDGSFESVEKALAIFEIALKHAPAVMYCIVDDLACLEHRTTEDVLGRLVSILQRPGAADTEDDGRHMQRPRTLKVLITAYGRCACLTRRLRREQVVLAGEAIVGGGRKQTGHSLTLGRKSLPRYESGYLKL